LSSVAITNTRRCALQSTRCVNATLPFAPICRHDPGRGENPT
jgi:hypothetical protein